MRRLRSQKIKKRQKRYRRIKFIVCMILIGFICMMTLWIEKCIANSIPKENNVISQEKDFISEKSEKEDEKIHEEKRLEINNEEKDYVTEEKAVSNKENKKYNYKEVFYKDVFIGDSITNALSFYHLLEDKKVVANVGDTLSKAEKRVDQVAKINPENIFILFGVNDLKAYRTEEEFVNHYERLICKLRNKLPNTNIYVQSILPVSHKVEQKRPSITNERISKMNNVLMNMCEKNNVIYIHISSIVENSNEDLHEGDGIHFQYKFYPIWLNFLIDYTKGEYKNENI